MTFHANTAPGVGETSTEQQPVQDGGVKLFTIIVFSENLAGVLN